MKICSECSAAKPISEFHTDRSRPDGLKYRCKACARARFSAWRSDNVEKDTARSASWKAKNLEYSRELARASNKRNPARVNANNRARTASKLRASPAWAVHFFIEEAYRLAQLRTQMFGCEWQVDHAVPLRSKHVCGLHTHDNLRVVSKQVNQAKGNRHWPDMP